MTVKELKNAWDNSTETGRELISNLFWNKYHSIKEDARVPRNCSVNVLSDVANKKGKFYIEFIEEANFYNDSPSYKRCIDGKDATWLRKFYLSEDGDFWM